MNSDVIIIAAVIATVLFMMFGILALVLFIRDMYKRHISFATVFCASAAVSIYFGTHLFAQSIWLLN